MNLTELFNALRHSVYLSTGVDIVVKCTVIFLAATIATAVLARGSAAARHRVWCLALSGSLGLPLLSLVVPEWPLAILPPVNAFAENDLRRSNATGVDADALNRHWQKARGVTQVGATTGNEQVTDPSFDSRSSPQHFPIVHSSVDSLLLWMWISGVVLALAPLVAGSVFAYRLKMHAKPLKDKCWNELINAARTSLGLTRSVQLFLTSREIVPMTCGTIRPGVYLPATCNQWNPARKRCVVLHELAHIRRFDLPWQWVSNLACAFLWFHPLAWYALYRLRVEREQACDDCVIGTGEQPSNYASELVAIARTYTGPTLVSGIAMARPSQLEMRLQSLFDRERAHAPLSRRHGLIIGIIAFILACLLASISPVTRAKEVQVNEDQPAQQVSQVQTQSKFRRDVPVAAAKVPDTAQEPPAVLDQVTPVQESELRQLTVTVRDVHGKPIESAQVSLDEFDKGIPAPKRRPKDPKPIAVASTDSTGVVSFKRIPITSAGVLVEHERHRRAFWGVDLKRPNAAITVYLLPATAGSIRDDSGTPVPGAQVFSWFFEVGGQPSVEPYPMASVSSDKYGHFRLSTDHNPAIRGSTTLVPIIAKDSLDRAAIVVREARELDGLLNLTLRPTRLVRVSFQLPTSTMHSPWVQWCDDQGRPIAARSTESDVSNKQLRLANFRLPPGAYQVVFKSTDITNELSVPFEVTNSAEDLDLGVHVPEPARFYLLAGKQAPALSVQTRGDARPDLVALKGKVVVLYFWADWCVPCVEGMPGIMQMADQYKEKPVAWFAIHDPSVPKIDELEKVVSRLQTGWGRPLNLQLALDRADAASKDQTGVTATRYSVTSWPTIVVIDRAGNVLANVIKEELESTIRKLLAENNERRSFHIDAHDQVVLLLAISDEIDPPMRKPGYTG